MTDDHIREGSIVNVWFENSPCIFGAVVLYTPQDTGDSWRLKDRSGLIIYVQLFSKMERVG